MDKQLSKEEIWLPVFGAESDYLVSSEGAVKSLSRTIIRSDGTTQTFKGKLRIPTLGANGYLMVGIKANGRWENRTIHSLVAEAFLLNGNKVPKYNCVNHKNGIKTDNRAVNLEVVTHSKNLIHAYETGLNNNKGNGHYASKLSNEDIDEIRRINPSGKETAIVAARYGITKNHLRDIVTFKKRTNTTQITINKDEIIAMLKEARDMLVLTSLLDKSGQCSELVNKIDRKFPSFNL